MAKQIVPHKVVIEFNEDASLKSGVLLYRIREDGEMKNQIKSIGIQNASFNRSQLRTILLSIKTLTETAEGIV